MAGWAYVGFWLTTSLSWIGIGGCPNFIHKYHHPEECWEPLNAIVRLLVVACFAFPITLFEWYFGYHLGRSFKFALSWLGETARRLIEF